MRDFETPNIVPPALRHAAYFLMFLLLNLSGARAQTVALGNDVARPIPGAGHDYIHLLNETVNPSNGSVNIKISLPAPPGRGLSLPFAITYDSAAAHHYSSFMAGCASLDNLNGGYCASPNLFTDRSSSGYGWSDTLPYVALSYWTTTITTSAGPYPTLGWCNMSASYNFFDPTGGSHALGLAAIGQYIQEEGTPLDDQGCQNVPPSGTYGYSQSGGDDKFSALMDNPCPGSIPGNPYPADCLSAAPAFTVTDEVGTVYSFPANTFNAFQQGSQPAETATVFPNTIEDRNGNILSYTITDGVAGLPLIDSAGRQMVSASNSAGQQPSTYTVGGLTYKLAYTTTGAHYSTASNQLSPQTNVGCTFHSQVDDSSYPVLHTITLPNDQTYTFDYDATYGVVSKIVYPDGGWVSYTWGLPTNSSGGPVYTDLATFTGLGNTTNLPAGPCYYQFQMPVILERQVGYSAGSSAAETQTFSYNTTWQSGTSSVYWGTKTTTVKTTDNARKLTSQTIYSYTPVYLSTQPDAYSLPSPEIAVENTVTTYDWGNTSTPLEQVTETWVDPYAMTSQTVELNNNPNLVSKTVYCYSNPCPTTSTSGSDILVQKQEYDFGQTSPTRTTNYSYYGFSQPSKIVVTNSSSTRLAETDAYYDGMTASSSTIVPVAGPSVTVVTGTHDETNKGPSSTQPRGNLTTLVRWASTGTSPTTTYTYDETGQLRSKTDACGNTTCSDMSGSLHTTTYSYADSPEGGNSPGNSNAYLTEIVHPVVNGIGMQERFAYDYATGNLTSSEDPNSNTTGYQYEDSLNRLTEITYPDGGTTKYTYNDSVPSVETSTLLTGSTWKTSLSTMDGLGHVISASLTSDPEGADTIATTYDGEGRVYTQTNPERSGSSATDGTTTFTYDALGRKTAQLQQDNTSYLYWCYNGVQSQGNLNCSSKAGSVSTGTWVDSTDENGNHWQRASDALGRLTSVMEPNPTSNALALETDYTYDALDNLLTVNQKGGSGDTARPARTFSYDGLSRLVTSYNPETGTICYGTYSGSTCNEGYDANGNLIAKTDARGAVTNYTYDALNRPTKKSYPTIPSGVAPTSTVGYVYDVTIGGWGWPTGESQTNVVGRLSEVTVGSSGANAWTVYGYDPMGRVALKSECLPMDCGNNHHDLVSKYDLAGNLSFYSRGLNVDSGLYFGGYAQAYDGAGRLTSVTGDTEGTNLATSILSNTVYYPTGQLNQSLQLGKYSSTRTYSNRGWFTGQNITNTAGLASWSSSAAYDPAGRVSGTTDAYARSWSYTYDHLNRLSTASGPNGSLSYSIDNFGNKTEQTVTAGTGPAPDYGVATTNALTGNGLTYDLAGNAGNVTYDGFHYYTYDAEGRLYSVGLQQGNPTTCYTYDGDGDRVATTNCNVVNHGNGTTVGIETEFLYDPAHRLMAEIKITGYSGQLTRANIYAGGEFLAEDSPDPFLTNTATATQLRITDQVGSLRGLSDLGNPSNLWSGAWKSFPYGDGAVAGDGADSQDNPGGMLFTGKERDAESGLDDFGARYYASTMGRFMSPDPLLSSGRPENPQTWNRYTYGLNNPLSIIDPTGLYNLVNNCAGDDSKCNKAFAQDAKNLKDGLAALTTAVNGLKDGDQKTALQGALKAFGTENDGNNVGVQFGALSGNTAGNTALSVDSSGKFNFTVTFDPSKNQGMFNQAINAAHEGQHVEDISDPRYASDSTTLSPFQLEYRGYQTSSYAGQALGVNSLSYGKDVLWNSSWRAVDTQTLRDKGITQHVTSIPGHPEPQAPTPHDPWK